MANFCVKKIFCWWIFWLRQGWDSKAFWMHKRFGTDQSCSTELSSCDLLPSCGSKLNAAGKVHFWVAQENAFQFSYAKKNRENKKIRQRDWPCYAFYCSIPVEIVKFGWCKTCHWRPAVHQCGYGDPAISFPVLDNSKCRVLSVGERIKYHCVNSFGVWLNVVWLTTCRLWVSLPLGDSFSQPSPLLLLTPDTILQRHRQCIMGLTLPKTFVIGLKKHKQARAFFSLWQNDNGFSHTFLQS